MLVFLSYKHLFGSVIDNLICWQIFNNSEKMKHKDGKPVYQQDKSSRVVPVTIMFIVLCGFSFYLGGIFCSEKHRFDANNIAKAVQSPKNSAASSLQIKSVAFPECSSEYQDYTPCTDPRVPN